MTAFQEHVIKMEDGETAGCEFIVIKPDPFLKQDIDYEEPRITHRAPVTSPDNRFSYDTPDMKVGYDFIDIKPDPFPKQDSDSEESGLTSRASGTSPDDRPSDDTPDIKVEIKQEFTSDDSAHITHLNVNDDIIDDILGIHAVTGSTDDHDDKLDTALLSITGHEHDEEESQLCGETIVKEEASDTQDDLSEQVALYSCVKSDPGVVYSAEQPALKLSGIADANRGNEKETLNGIGINISSVCQTRKQVKHNSVRKQHKCEVCYKIFKRLPDLKRHMRVHTGEKPHKCEICNKRFADTSKLMAHMRTHTGEKPYECELCNRSFAQLNNLKRHAKTHTGIKPYKCDLCDKSFADLQTLKGHMRTHTGEKPYHCELCNKSFAHSGCLQRHTRTHTGEKPYTCERCKRSFSFLESLKKHRRKHWIETL